MTTDEELTRLSETNEACKADGDRCGEAMARAHRDELLKRKREAR